MKLEELQKRIPGAEAVAGDVIAHYNGKHCSVGKLLTDGLVSLSDAATKILAEQDAASLEKVQSTLDDANGGKPTPRVRVKSPVFRDNEFELP